MGFFHLLVSNIQRPENSLDADTGDIRISYDV